MNETVRVIDVSDPTNPYHASQLAVSALTLALDAPYLYAAGWSNGLVVMDVSNPLNPTVVVPQFPVDGIAKWITLEGDLAYMVGTSATSGFWIVDVTQPSTPVLVGSLPIPSNGPDLGSVVVAGLYAYVTGSGYLRVVDITNPASPVEVANIETGPLYGPVVVAPPYIYAIRRESQAASGPLLILQTDYMTSLPSPLAGSFKLAQNFPNPFNPSTTIGFELETQSHTSIVVFDIQGRLVRRVLDETMSAGPHSISWDGRDGAGRVVPSGVYFYRLTADGRSQAKKMVILK